MNHLDLDTLTLAHGAHKDRSNGLCLLEAVAWWAGEDHTDHPACVSPVLGQFGRNLNDVLPNGKRQELRQFIPGLPGTAGDGLDERRGYLALDWLVRTYLPGFLVLVPSLAGHVTAVRELAPISGMTAARRAGPVVRAAGDAAWAAARAAAGDAAWAAAGAAAGDAAWAAAGAAAGAAARDAARAAARDAARNALAPTIAQLQDSAIGLYGAMIGGAS
jgi:hypothetical protein